MDKALVLRAFIVRMDDDVADLVAPETGQKEDKKRATGRSAAIPDGTWSRGIVSSYDGKKREYCRCLRL